MKQWAVMDEITGDIFQDSHLVFGGDKTRQPFHGLCGRQVADLHHFSAAGLLIFLRDGFDKEAVFEGIESHRIVSIVLFYFRQTRRREDRRTICVETFDVGDELMDADD